MALYRDDDVELLGRWRLGDQAAANKLVSRYSGPVRSFLRRKLHIDADDVLQETFAILFANTGRFRNVSSARSLCAFILRTALYQALAERRRRNRIEHVGPLEESDDAPVSDGNDALRLRFLDEAFDRLTPESQHLLRLTYAANCTRAEIAAQLGIPEGTVSTRLHRARRQLRRMLDRIE
jgi:RNA polymerase sigma-70 factor (ECF subfamily)